MKPRTLTTFQAAKICDVFASTVIQWIEKGKLKAYKTPGGHRRIFASDLLEFLKEYKMPIPDWLNAESAEEAKVLIVDDEPRIGRLLKLLFSRLGRPIDARVVHSGVEALVVIGKWMPDLVVLDAVMPIVDGPEVCASLKADPQTKHIKIIAMSGKRLPEETMRFLKKNTDAFLLKPFDMAKMKEISLRLLAAEVQQVTK